MYNVEMYGRVRRAVHVEGMSIREAARMFGLHRDTVRKMLEYSVPPGYRRQRLPERPKLFPWLPEGGLILVYGPRGIGKTFFTLGLASSLVTGATFIRWEPTKTVGVLYVDGEMQLGDLRERIMRQLDRAAIQPFEIVSH